MAISIGILLTFHKQMNLDKDITCGIGQETAVKPLEHFETTNSVTYDRKIPTQELRTCYNPPPPHFWDMHYINDFRSRYLAGGYRRPLSPSHQKSEMKDAYQNMDGPSELWRPLGMQPFELKCHHIDGPSEVS